MQSVDLIAWRILAVSSRNIAIYVSNDYIVRQTITHIIIASTTTNNNRFLYLFIRWIELSVLRTTGAWPVSRRIPCDSSHVTEQASKKQGPQIMFDGCLGTRQ